jgi:hypothetical protein
VLLLGLYTPDHVVFPFIWPSEFLDGGMNDLSVYVHYCGWYLSGCVCLNIFGKGVIVVFLVWVVLVLGAFFHAMENLTLYCMGIYCMYSLVLRYPPISKLNETTKWDASSSRSLDTGIDMEY